MREYVAVALLVAGVTLIGCTSDPNAPVNQSFPVKQMDQFFDSLSPPPPATGYRSSTPYPPNTQYTHVPGYAPAYPPYE